MEVLLFVELSIPLALKAHLLRPNYQSESFLNIRRLKIKDKEDKVKVTAKKHKAQNAGGFWNYVIL